jgi:acyl carrier protein
MGIAAELDAETPLVSSGIIDSLRFAELLALVEKHYGVKIDANDVGIDNFDTAAQILAYVEAVG